MQFQSSLLQFENNKMEKKICSKLIIQKVPVDKIWIFDAKK